MAYPVLRVEEGFVVLILARKVYATMFCDGFFSAKFLRIDKTDFN